MPKPPIRRILNGRRRLVSKRRATPKTRTIQLSSLEIDYRHNLQNIIRAEMHAARLSLRNIEQLAYLQVALSGDGTQQPNYADALLQMEKDNYRCYVKHLEELFRKDHKLHDMNPLDENRTFLYTPWRDLRLRDWGEVQTLDNTGFKKGQLLRIYKQFGLHQLCEEHHTNVIGVSTGHYNADGSECRYLFHPEELFLFTMTKCRLGHNNKHLVNDKFGGEFHRWSYGYPFMLFYLCKRYKNVIGHNHLLKYVKDFPRFHEAIKQFYMRPSVHHENEEDGGRVWELPGLADIPWLDIGYVDCNNTQIDVPMSGPAGDYEGAPRKAGAKEADEALYSGFIKDHAIKLETVKLPNGVSTMFGVASCRNQDVGGMLRMSGLDEFMHRIQANQDRKYTLAGDLIYCAYYLRCIHTYFRKYGRNDRLTEYEKICNMYMKKGRQRIEFDYQGRNELNQICRKRSEFRLGKKCPYAVQQLCVCHLLSNIYNCLNGSKAANFNCFRCTPPRLEEYLDLRLPGINN